MSEKTERLLRQRIRKLTVQNSRLREIVETFASRSLLQAEAPERLSSAITISLLEGFTEPRVPSLNTKKGAYGGFSAATVSHDNTWFPTFMGNLRPLDPTPGWRCLTAHGAPIRLGFNLIGLDSQRVEEAVAKVEERQLRDRDFIPVFITDLTDFEVFRLRGYVFEYVPASVGRAPENRRTERRYLKQRLELIKAKWNLRDIVDL